MRKVIFAINTSLDGCCGHTKFNPDEELLEYFTGLVRDADAFAPLLYSSPSTFTQAQYHLLPPSHRALVSHQPHSPAKPLNSTQIFNF